MIDNNLCGEFITHKLFGRGQILTNENGVVTVRFCETDVVKKFIYPSSIETFLMLENPVSATQYRQIAEKIADEKALAGKDAADRRAQEKLAMKKQLKSVKKPPKKIVKEEDEEEAEEDGDPDLG